MTQRNVKEALAKVVARKHEQKRVIGTAFFISGTQLLTAQHVVDGIEVGETLWVDGFFGHSLWPGKSIAHPNRDLALITIEPNDVHTSTISVSLAFKIPESGKVTVYGFTGGSDKCDSRERSLIQSSEIYNALRFDSSIPKGFSGGPILDESQLCIGVTYARVDDTDCSYGTPASVIQDWLQKSNALSYQQHPKPVLSITKPNPICAEETEQNQTQRSNRYICFMGREDILDCIDRKKTGNYGVALAVTYINRDWCDGFALRLQDYNGKGNESIVSADWPQKELGNIDIRESQFWKDLCQSSAVKLHESDRDAIKHWLDTKVKTADGRLVIKCDLYAHKDKNFPVQTLSNSDFALVGAILKTWCSVLGVDNPQEKNPLYPGRVILFFSVRLNEKSCRFCSPKWFALNRAKRFIKVFQNNHISLCNGLELPELNDTELHKWKYALGKFCQLPGSYPQRLIELGEKILQKGKIMHADFKFHIESNDEYKQLLKETQPKP